ncbi:hypothetical protein NDU88_002760 [Pleurodeles waltl]|uniref:Uncharacterized protein n=1 Tax=Pleurodeles waltl TaxID=8319 RepID=A0AAV7UAN8_PLEWA|nr:hypothetical protein NDU88_002760 [Pleurodeles waltl]
MHPPMAVPGRLHVLTSVLPGGFFTCAFSVDPHLLRFTFGVQRGAAVWRAPLDAAAAPAPTRAESGTPGHSAAQPAVQRQPLEHKAGSGDRGRGGKRAGLPSTSSSANKGAPSKPRPSPQIGSLRVRAAVSPARPHLHRAAQRGLR